MKIGAGRGERLYCDDNHKILGGVCSGIAAYLGIDPVIVRIVFIISRYRVPCLHSSLDFCSGKQYA